MAHDWFIRCAAPPRPPEGSPAPAPTADPAARVLALEARLFELSGDLAALTALLEEEARHNPEQDEALAAARSRLAELEAKLARAAPAPVPRRLEAKLGRMLCVLRPDLRLLRGCLSVCVGEYARRDGVLRALAELQADGARPEGWKMLRGADRWWERHVSTGQDDAGRAYARFDRAARAWDVLFGWKGEQDRDIAWLRRQ